MSTQRIPQLDPTTATGTNRQFFDALESRLGLIPNMAKTMAQSPAVLEGYLSFSGALGKGALPAKLREQLALAVGAANSCDYCASAHSVLGKLAGLDQAQISFALTGHSTDAKTEAALRFARVLVEKRGLVSDADAQAVEEAGYTGGEVAEIVAHVALNTLTNYFNNVARTEIDFPKVELAKLA